MLNDKEAKYAKRKIAEFKRRFNRDFDNKNKELIYEWKKI